jgi:hypothetical protein
MSTTTNGQGLLFRAQQIARLERERRTQNISTKLTSSEETAVLSAAARSKKSISEWAREALLEKAQGSSSEPLAMHIFTECVGNQMLMMNCFEPLLKAVGATQEHVQARFQQVQATKAAKAHELLEKRAERRRQEAAQAKL